MSWDDVPFDDSDGCDALAAKVAAAELSPGERGAFAAVRVWNAVIVLATSLGYVLAACLGLAFLLALAVGLPLYAAVLFFAAALVSAGVNRGSQELQKRWYRHLLQARGVDVRSVGGASPVALPAVRDDVTVKTERR